MQRETAQRRIQLQQKSKSLTKTKKNQKNGGRQSFKSEESGEYSNQDIIFRYGDIATEMMAQLKQEQASSIN